MIPDTVGDSPPILRQFADHDNCGGVKLEAVGLMRRNVSPCQKTVVCGTCLTSRHYSHRAIIMFIFMPQQGNTYPG